MMIQVLVPVLVGARVGAVPRSWLSCRGYTSGPAELLDQAGLSGLSGSPGHWLPLAVLTGSDLLHFLFPRSFVLLQ